MSGGMTGKQLVFVRGHKHPTVAPLVARFVRRHPDGSPMVATSTKDTLEACEARWERAQVVEERPARKRTKKEEDDA